MYSTKREAKSKEGRESRNPFCNAAQSLRPLQSGRRSFGYFNTPDIGADDGMKASQLRQLGEEVAELLAQNL